MTEKEYDDMIQSWSDSQDDAEAKVDRMRDSGYEDAADWLDGDICPSEAEEVYALAGIEKAQYEINHGFPYDGHSYSLPLDAAYDGGFIEGMLDYASDRFHSTPQTTYVRKDD